MGRTLVRILAATVVVGCGIADGSDAALQLGELDGAAINASFAELPDTVSVGSLVDVSAATIGPGCVSAESRMPKPARTDVQYTDSLSVVITPYDSVAVEMPSSCAGVAALFPHIASVQFFRSGQAKIRIMGAGGAEMAHELIVHQVARGGARRPASFEAPAACFRERRTPSHLPNNPDPTLLLASPDEAAAFVEDGAFTAPPPQRLCP